MVEPEVRVFALQPEGPPLTLWADSTRWPEPASASRRTAKPILRSTRGAVARVVPVLSARDHSTGREGPVARRRAERREARERVPSAREEAGAAATRALPMAIADYVAETFESDAMRGAIASRGRPAGRRWALVGGHDGRWLADSAGNDGGAAGQSDDRPGRPRRAERSRTPLAGFGAEIPPRPRSPRSRSSAIARPACSSPTAPRPVRAR